ncbi:MAG TPA: Hsp70 family protein, partial [Bacteroidales bacterium]|nr:Hsp70 family protein [Bacteroidales bacterium]
TQSIRIEASTGLTDQEIERMKEEAQRHADEDRKLKEKIDKVNQADNLIYSTEKQLKDFGNKIPPENRAEIESALNALKDAHKSQDVTAIDSAMARLNDAWQKASTYMYESSDEENEDKTSSKSQKQSNENDFTDVDYEEVN